MNNKLTKNIRKTLIAVCFVNLFLYFDGADYIFSQDHGLWEQAGWKSIGDEHTKRVEFLLWLGADPAYVYDDGVHGPVSVLEHAVEWQNLEIIDLLLPLLPAESHANAMEYACRRGGHDIAIDFLSNKGIKPSHPLDPEKVKISLPEVCFESS